MIRLVTLTAGMALVYGLRQQELPDVLTIDDFYTTDDFYVDDFYADDAYSSTNDDFYTQTDDNDIFNFDDDFYCSANETDCCFSEITTAPKGPGWTSISTSQSGEIMYATAYEVGVYVSTDFGSTWERTTAPYLKNWTCVYTSQDGSHVAASADIGHIYISDDTGTTWTKTNVGAKVEFKYIYMYIVYIIPLYHAALSGVFHNVYLC